MLLIVSSGCATTQQLRTPGNAPVYVSVFVDETKAGEVGYALSEAMRLKIYRSAPELLAYTIEEGTLVVDGTVVDQRVLPAADGTLELSVVVDAKLRREGSVVFDLGEHRQSGRFFAAKDQMTTEVRRQQVLVDVIDLLAASLLNAIRKSE